MYCMASCWGVWPPSFGITKKIANVTEDTTNKSSTAATNRRMRNAIKALTCLWLPGRRRDHLPPWQGERGGVEAEERGRATEPSPALLLCTAGAGRRSRVSALRRLAAQAELAEVVDAVGLPHVDVGQLLRTEVQRLHVHDRHQGGVVHVLLVDLAPDGVALGQVRLLRGLGEQVLDGRVRVLRQVGAAALGV